MHEVVIVLAEGECDIGLFDALCLLDQLQYLIPLRPNNRSNNGDLSTLSRALNSIQRVLGCDTTLLQRRIRCRRRQQRNSGRIFVMRDYAQDRGLDGAREILCDLVNLLRRMPRNVHVYILLHLDCDPRNGSCTRVENLYSEYSECRNGIQFNLKYICSSSNNKLSIYILEHNNIDANIRHLYVVVPKPDTESVLGIDPEPGRTYDKCRDSVAESRGELCGELCDRKLAELCRCSLAH